MSFLSDLGGFLNEVQHVTSELDAVKQDIVSSAKEAIVQIETQSKEVAGELKSNADDITTTTKNVTSDIKSRLENN